MTLIWCNTFARRLFLKSKDAIHASKCVFPERSQGRHFTTEQKPYTLDDVADLIKSQECWRVIFMAGAGISTPSGIQDFRTPGTGLYYNLQKYDLPYPEAIFDIGFFQLNPKPFFEYAKELMPGRYKPNPAHFLPVLFERKGKLLRMFTQNIDGLESLAGVPSERLVEAHGTFSTATCLKCYKKYSLEDIKEPIYKSEIPECNRQGCKGIIKPDIVFFGENLPPKFHLSLEDCYDAQLLIVMGTSLEVMPFAGIAEEVPQDIPRLLINKEHVGYFGSRKKDVVIIGDVVGGVQQLIERLGWTEELNRLCGNSHTL